MKYLLIGINGVYNYGCEAIIRGTERILQAVDPKADIVYATPAPEDDRKRLNGCNIRYLQRKMLPKYSPRRITAKVLRNLPFNLPVSIDDHRPYRNENFDYVLSIGGDMYTLDPKNRPPLAIIGLGNYFMDRRIPYVLWGASVGPFTEKKQSEDVIMRHLKEMKFLTIREPETIEYLKACDVSENVVPCGDPAFTVCPEIAKQKDSFFGNGKIRIALNLSPLSAGFSGLGQTDIMEQQRQWIIRQLSGKDVVFTLVPHVVPPVHNVFDDDYLYLTTLKKSIPEEYQDRISLLPKDLGFIGTKKRLIKCDLCIAARMHCAINAVSALVPTIFLSYSKKSIGMSEMVYRTADYAIPLSKLGELSFDRDMILALHQSASASVPLIRTKAFEAGKIFT